MEKKVLVFAGWILAGTFAATAQSGGGVPTQAEMHAKILSLYDFHPAALTDAERQKKSAEMDRFWEESKLAGPAVVPLLRTELNDPSSPQFFAMDGSELLLSLSRTSADEQAVAKALPRVDLADTQGTPYFYAVHDLAAKGYDVTTAALHILDEPKFAVSVPQHAMVLDQRMALMYLLLSMDESLWVKQATERLRTEKDVQAKIALVNALFYAQTEEADRAWKAVLSDTSQPAELLKLAKMFADQSLESTKAKGVSGNVENLRKERRQRLKAVSDEAIYDVQEMTVKIATLRTQGKK